MAKRFYILLYLFLTRTYKNVELVFLYQNKRLTNTISSIPKETSGTIVSSTQVIKRNHAPTVIRPVNGISTRLGLR